MTEHRLGEVARGCLDPTALPVESDELLAAYVGHVRGTLGFADELDEVGQVLSERMPAKVLDALLLDQTISPAVRRQLFGASVRDRYVLARLPVGAMVAWIHDDAETRAELLAAAIPVFEDQADAARARLSAHASALIAECPHPERVVGAFAQAVFPTSWSGSLAEIIARRRKALEEMHKHPAEAVRTETARLLAELEAAERAEHARELQWAREEDERFE